MTVLHYDFLKRLFVEVDEELSERVGERVLIVGGVALIFAGLRRGTEDVDAISRIPPGPLKEAIRVVGRRHNLREDWFNDRTHHFAPEEVLLGEPRLVFEGRNIQIYRPDLTYILAMKLRAARPKDEGDVLWLMKQTGIKAKGALIHLAEWIYPSEPVTRYMEWFIGQTVRKFGE